MKIIYLIITLCCFSVSNTHGQFISEPFDYSADSTKVLAVQTNGVWSTAKKPFTFIVMPDTQSYAKDFPDVFRIQVEWIAAHADSIAFVMHLGDIVTNSASTVQWDAAKVMYFLDGRVPYVMAVGNHDLGTHGNSDNRNSTLFNQYFPYQKHSKAPSFGGAYEVGKMENAFYTFEAGCINWLVLALEFGPRNKVLDWASTIIAQHPNHKVILDTHAYMYSDDTRMTTDHKWLPNTYGLGQQFNGDGTPILDGDGLPVTKPDNDPEHANDGEEIWQKLMSQYPNTMMVFSGHVLNGGVGTLVSNGVHGNKVYQMLSNYQNLVNVDYTANGVTKNISTGDSGFFRIVTVDPVKNTLSVKTYSPYVDMYLRGPEHPNQEFIFENVSF